MTNDLIDVTERVFVGQLILWRTRKTGR